MLFFVSIALQSSPSFAAGEAPTAEAGLGLIAYVGDTVVLDGSGSTDPEGDTLTYTWSQVGGPPVELTRGDTTQPRFDVGAAGTLRFALVVSDGTTDSAADQVEVVIPHEEIRGVEAGCATTRGPLALGALFGLAALARRRR